MWSEWWPPCAHSPTTGYLGVHTLCWDPMTWSQNPHHFDNNVSICPETLVVPFCPTCCQGCGSGQATFLILMAVTVAMNWLGKPGSVMIFIGWGMAWCELRKSQCDLNSWWQYSLGHLLSPLVHGCMTTVQTQQLHISLSKNHFQT